MRVLLNTFLVIAAIALLLGIAGVFGTELIIVSVLISLALGIMLIPSALRLTGEDDSYYHPSEH